MLSRGFKPAKCKTALNLGKARIKLMRNKKDVQLKQLRREIAQLLQNGQHQTARIRVEHVVREEKTLAAYEMIEIYCELVVARLPIIESQKNCPIDLKESVTSLIFAAPRCADIPELEDVRKHFASKYGKDFINAALELRPACGVSRILAEKLSVKAPDGPTKVEILKGIAEEHNIQWEPNWFKDEESISAGDILTTPHINTSNTIQMQPLNIQIADDPHSTENVETSSQSHTRANPMETQSNPTSKPDFNSSGSVSEPSQDWNLGFKDATAAAQAAAESAERASMAARAAAQFSIRDSSRSSMHGQGKHEERTPNNSSFNQRSQEGVLNERHDEKSTNKEFSQSEGKSPSRDPVFNPSISNGDLKWSNSSNIQRYESESESEAESELAENPLYGDDVGPRNQPSKFYSESSGNEVDAKTTIPSKFNSMKDETFPRDYGGKSVFKEPDENEYGFGSSSSVFDGIHQGTSRLDIDDKVGHSVTSAVFNESGSDDDNEHIFHPAEKYRLHSDILSPRHSLFHKENLPFEPDLSESFRESPIYSKLIEPLPVTFDDYDDETSPRSKKVLQTETFGREIESSYNHGKPTSDNREFDSSSELNLGSLPGGRRNRPYSRPPYTKGDFTAVSSPSRFSEVPSQDFVPNEDNSEKQSYSRSIHENVHKTRAKYPTDSESDENASEDDVPKPAVTKSVQGSGISRRTKGSTKMGNISSSSRTVDESDLSDEDPIYELRSRTKVSGNKKSFSPVEKPVTPTVSSEKAPSRENSGKSLSHVHPKLPDFETFAAHLQSLRTNRR